MQNLPWLLGIYRDASKSYDGESILPKLKLTHRVFEFSAGRDRYCYTASGKRPLTLQPILWFEFGVKCFSRNAYTQP